MKLSKAIMMLSCGIVLFAACKKDETTPNNNGNNNNGNNNTKGKKELLVDGKWQITALSTTYNDGTGDTTIDSYADWDACMKDDFTTFSADGKGVNDEGATKCDATDPQTDNFTWSLIDNDTKIRIVEAGEDDDTSDIVEITATQIKLKEAFNSQGVAGTTTITFKNIK